MMILQKNCFENELPQDFRVPGAYALLLAHGRVRNSFRNFS